MKLVLQIVGVGLAICAAASAVTLVVMVLNLNDASYGIIALLGRLVITLFIGAGSMAAFQKAKNP